MLNLELRLNGETVGKLEVDAVLLARWLHATEIESPTLAPVAQSVEAPPAPVAIAVERVAPKSSPLTGAQALELLGFVNRPCAEFLSRLAANRGELSWRDTKGLFDIQNYEAFAAGPGQDIARAMRHILRDKSAQLVWRDEREWGRLADDDDEGRLLCVNGSALQALREATRR